MRKTIPVLVLISCLVLTTFAAVSAAAAPAVAQEVSQTDNRRCYFGNAVDTAGDVNGDGYDDVVIGAIGCDAAYVYYGSGAELDTTPDWSYSSDQGIQQFAQSVGTAGDVNGDGYDDVIIGDRGYIGSSGQSQGRALVFYGSAAGLSTTPEWTVISDEVPGQFGYSVGTAGDVNDDGYDDVVVGNPAWNVSKAFVYLGSATGLYTTATTLSQPQYSYFESGVGTAGDVDDDGYDDVVVGAYQYGLPTTGGAFAYSGSATGVGTTAMWSSVGEQRESRYGFDVATMGDVNDDGYGDIVVEEPSYSDDANEYAGRVYAFYGSDTGPSAVADWILTGEHAGERLSSSNAAGDVNSDGYADLIVGSQGYDSPSGPLDGAGRARIFYGSAQGLEQTASWAVIGDQEDGSLGNSVASAGDVDGNGYVDVIVGATKYDGTDEDEGRAYVYCGYQDGLSTTPCWTLSPPGVDYGGNHIYLPLIVKG